MKINHICLLKLARIIQGKVVYRVFVRVSEEDSFDGVEETLYSGYIVYPIELASKKTDFFDTVIIKDFGNITVDELIENYPEYLI